LAACQTTPEATPLPVDMENSNSAYPGPSSELSYPGTGRPAENTGYPVGDSLIEGIESTPPDPRRELPEAPAQAGVLGGVLVREITGQGFLPLIPKRFILGEVVYNDQGVPAYVKGSAHAHEAELFPTGVFIFRNVPPGMYGLIVDVGYTEFPIQGADNTPLLVEVAAGQSVDLGQLITILPGS
jgi:hypothetical protein